MNNLENGALEYAQQFIDGLKQKFVPSEQNSILIFIINRIKQEREEAIESLKKDLIVNENIMSDFQKIIINMADQFQTINPGSK